MTKHSNEFDELDRKVADAMASIRVPDGLRAKIVTALASEIESPATRAASWMTPILSVAAAILVGLFATIMLPQPTSAPSLVAQATDFLDRGIQLTLVTSNIDEIQAWLKEDANISGMKMPDKLAELEAAGCQKVTFAKKQGVLVCFRLPNGKLAHLFAFPNGPGTATEGRRSAFVSRNGRWSSASWSDRDMQYLLMVPGSTELSWHLIDAA